MLPCLTCLKFFTLLRLLLDACIRSVLCPAQNYWRRENRWGSLKVSLENAGWWQTEISNKNVQKKSAKTITPIYGFSSVPQINMIKQKKSITTIFEHVFLYLFFRPSCEEVQLKKVVINFLNLATFTFSTSVFHIMCKSSYGFHFICSFKKMK